MHPASEVDIPGQASPILIPSFVYVLKIQCYICRGGATLGSFLRGTFSIGGVTRGRPLLHCSWVGFLWRIPFKTGHQPGVAEKRIVS